MRKEDRLKIDTRKFQFVLDEFFLLKYFQGLNGRHWGLAGILGLDLGLLASFIIKTDLWTRSATFSQFGTDIRTAPYFTASLFFGAYGLWRWRNYLRRTTHRPGITTTLITLTILGLYVVAFMPLGWTHRVTQIHYFGFFVAGVSIMGTVIVDMLLYKTRDNKYKRYWQSLRLISTLFILAGIVITSLSSTALNEYLKLGLVGEISILIGYTTWVFIKTYQGDCPNSNLAGFLDKVTDIE